MLLDGNMSRDHLAMVGTDIVLSATIKGMPIPTVTWKKNGEEVPAKCIIGVTATCPGSQSLLSFGEVILSSVVIPPPEVTLSSAVLKLAQESVAINVQCLCKEHVPPVELHIKSRGTALTQSPEIFPLNFRKKIGRAHV